MFLDTKTDCRSEVEIPVTGAEYGTFISKESNNKDTLYVGGSTMVRHRKVSMYKILLVLYMLFCAANIIILFVYWLNVGYINHFVLFILLPMVCYVFSCFIFVTPIKKYLFNIMFFNLSWYMWSMLMYIIVIHDEFYDLFSINNVLSDNAKSVIISIVYFIGYMIQIYLSLYVNNILDKIQIYTKHANELNKEQIIESPNIKKIMDKQRQQITYLQNKIKIIDKINKITVDQDEYKMLCLNCNDVEQKYQTILNEKDILLSKLESKKQMLYVKKNENKYLRNSIENLQNIVLKNKNDFLYVSNKNRELVKQIKTLNVTLNIERKQLQKAQEFIQHINMKN